MSDRATPWAKIVIVNVVVTIVLAVVALAVGEAYLRLTIPSSSNEGLFESTLKTKRYKLMKPNFTMVAWGSELRTNALGFRDNKAEVPAKRPSTFRVIVLGDSFTVSAGVDFDKIYTSLLEQELKKKLGDVEVLNLAVGGYDIVQYALVLDEVGLSLMPDFIVVSTFPFNDLNSDTYRANLEDAMGHHTVRATPWYQDLYIYRALLVKVEWRLRSLLHFGGAREAAQAPKVDFSESDKRENLMALEHIADVAKSRGIDLAVVMLPNTDQFQEQRADFAPFEQECREHQWRCVNLLDGFVDARVSPKTLRLNALDSHPNGRYNALVSTLLVESLLPAFEASAVRARRGP